MSIFFELLALCTVCVLLIGLIYIAATGAPYAVTGEHKIEALMSLLTVQDGEKAVDLGSGDGRMVIALAKAGAEAHGYEINPFLVYLSRRNIRKYNLEERATIHWKSFWHECFTQYTIVTLFGSPHIMRRLGRKLRKELHPGSRIVSVSFTFPDWKEKKEKDRVHLYET